MPIVDPGDGFLYPTLGTLMMDSYNIYPLDDAKGALENAFCDLFVFNPLLHSLFLDHDIIFYF